MEEENVEVERWTARPKIRARSARPGRVMRNTAVNSVRFRVSRFDPQRYTSAFALITSSHIPYRAVEYAAP
jgi:hypothetical protein